MNHYNSRGYLEKVVREDTGGLSASHTMNARGQLEQQQLGNGLTIDKTYNELNGYIEQIRTESQQHVVQDLGFAFNAIGNLTSRIDYLQNNLVEQFSYDMLNRLTSNCHWR